MNKGNENLIVNNHLDLALLLDRSRKPVLFSKREELFWDDPHISQQMLLAHLDPLCEEASRNHKTIDQTVRWLVDTLHLKEGARILDLGCGPGLYTTRFYQHGYKMVGMDYSKNSINYAVKFATEHGMNIQYLYQNYLTMDYTCEFDAVFLIYCDFGALIDSDRDTLLERILRALKPEGLFVFDVCTRLNWEQPSLQNWYVSESGFWRPYPHLVLEQRFHYEEENVFLNQHTVIGESGEMTTYKIWDHYYTRETITQLLREHGFEVQDIWSDLTGKPYEEKTINLGVVAKKSQTQKT